MKLVSIEVGHTIEQAVERINGMENREYFHQLIQTRKCVVAVFKMPEDAEEIVGEWVNPLDAFSGFPYRHGVVRS